MVNAIIVNEKYIQGTEFEKKIYEEREKTRKKEVKEEIIEKKEFIIEKPKKRLSDSVEITDFRGKDLNNIQDWFSNKNIKVVHNQEKEKDRPIVKDLIIIDTPGFNDESVNDVDKFKANIDILEFFFSQSSLVLFLVSTDHMLSIGCSLHMLQLTLLDPDTKKSLIQQSKEVKSDSNSESFFSSLVSGACKFLKLILDKMVESKLQSFKGKESEEKIKQQFFGASMYEKVYFVINKIDLCKNVNYSFYELGCSIGRKFQYLPLPMAHHIFGIGIPNEQMVKKNGQLEELEELINTLRDESQLQLRIINHIQYIYQKILEIHNQTNDSYFGYVKNTIWSDKHLERAKELVKLLKHND